MRGNERTASLPQDFSTWELLKLHGEMEKKKRVKYHDTDEEFRVRFVDTLGYNRENLYVFVNPSIHNVENFVKLYSHEDVATAISRNRKKTYFKRIMKNYAATSDGLKTLWDLFLRYFPEAEYFQNFMDDMFHRFFKGNWPIKRIYNQSRREDEKALMTKCERLVLVVVFGYSTPIDIGYVILSYLEYNYELICTLGIVDENWYRLIMQTWPSVTFWGLKRKFDLIPRTVRQAARIIKLDWTLDHTNNVNFEEYITSIFSTITPSRIVELDMSSLRIRKDDCPESLDYIDETTYPSLRKIKVASYHHICHLVLYRLRFPRLREVNLTFVDFSYLRKHQCWDNMKEMISKVTLRMWIHGTGWACRKNMVTLRHSDRMLEESMDAFHSLTNLKDLDLYVVRVVPSTWRRAYSRYHDFEPNVNEKYLIDLGKFEQLETFVLGVKLAKLTHYYVGSLKIHKFFKVSRSMKLKNLTWSENFETMGKLYFWMVEDDYSPDDGNDLFLTERKIRKVFSEGLEYDCFTLLIHVRLYYASQMNSIMSYVQRKLEATEKVVVKFVFFCRFERVEIRRSRRIQQLKDPKQLESTGKKEYIGEGIIELKFKKGSKDVILKVEAPSVIRGFGDTAYKVRDLEFLQEFEWRMVGFLEENFSLPGDFKSLYKILSTYRK